MVIILFAIGPCVVILNCLRQVLYLGRAPRTNETLPDFCEWCRVTRHPQIFRGLTGCQRTPREWGVTAWYQSLGIGSSGLGIHHHLVWFNIGLGMRLPRKARTKLEHGMHVF